MPMLRGSPSPPWTWVSGRFSLTVLIMQPYATSLVMIGEKDHLAWQAQGFFILRPSGIAWHSTLSDHLSVDPE